MDERNDLNALASDDSTTRALAALRLKDSFDEKISDRLVQMLLDERDRGAFVLVCDAVIPKWIVKFERELSDLDVWPFDSLRTAWLIRGVRGWRLPSIESRINQFLEDEDWILRLATVDYCHDKMTYTEAARNVCLQFLTQKIGSMEDKQKLVRALRRKTFRQLSAHIRSMVRDFTPLSLEP